MSEEDSFKGVCDGVLGASFSRVVRQSVSVSKGSGFRHHRWPRKKRGQYKIGSSGGVMGVWGHFFPGSSDSPLPF